MMDRKLFVLLMVGIGALFFAGLLFFSDLDLGLVFGVALGIPSFIYASVQFAVAAGTVDGLIELKQQLSTKRLDEWPHFMRDISKLMKLAKKEIIIFCDFPAYGAVNSPRDYRRYLETIDHLRRDVDIKLLCLDEETRGKLARDFYADARNRKITSRYESPEYFLEKIQCLNNRALRRQFNDAETHETSFVMPLYFWIVDSEFAIFSIKRKFKNADVIEVGFQTSDRPLVEALSAIFEEYRELSKSHALYKKTAVGGTKTSAAKAGPPACLPV
jgi:hypothetical protein